MYPQLDTSICPIVPAFTHSLIPKYLGTMI